MSPGFFSSFMDIAPNFAGTTFGIANTLGGALFGTTVPIFVGAMIQARNRILNTVQRSAKKYANLAKQDPGRAKQNR